MRRMASILGAASGEAYRIEKNTQRGARCDGKSRGEKQKQRAARGARESVKGKNERGGETGKRDEAETEDSNLVGEDCFHSGAQIEKERENRDAKAC